MVDRSSLLQGSALTALAVAVFGVQAAVAVAAPEPDPAAAAAAPYEEILVTAQKRSQSAQEIPLSITVLGGDQIERLEIRTANDIVRLIPNASADRTEGRSRPRWFIRGIGTNDPSNNVVNPVGVYIDEVYVNSPQFQAFPTFDLERVEVLRGPQGTLWGKNTVGGAIHYISKKPSFDTDGYVSVGVGNLESRSAEGAFGGSLIDGVVAARGSFSFEKRGGLAHNTVTGSDEGTGRYQDGAARVQFLVTPSDNFKALASFRYRQLNGEAVPRYLVPADPDTTKGNPAFGGNPAVGGNYRETDDYGNRPSGDRGLISANAENIADLDQTGATLTLDWDLGAVTLTSITAYDDGGLTNAYDTDWTAFEGSRSYATIDAKQFTQEFRIASPQENRLNWIVGAHYFYEDFLSDSSTGTLTTTQYADRNSGAARWRHAFYQNVVYGQETNSYALFGNATYKVTPALSLAVGLRYTSEKKSADIDIYNGNGEGAVRRPATATPNAVIAGRPVWVFTNPAEWWRRSSVGTAAVNPYVADASETWNRVTWDITPQYQVNRDLLLYAKAARGFRSGTFQGSATQSTQFDTKGIRPEDLYSYEAGLKSSWLDGKLTANLAAFYYDYKDIQVLVQGVPVNVGGTTQFTALIRNAKGWSKGIELDLNANPVEGLRLGGSFGFLKTKYTDDFIPLPNTTPQQYFGKGNEFTRAPRFTANVNADYRVPLSWGAIQIGTDWSYRSKYWFTVNAQQDDPTKDDYIGSQYQRDGNYVLGNAYISFLTPNDKVEIQAWVRNLTNTEYKILTFAAQQGARLTTLGDPRTYGLSVTGRF